MNIVSALALVLEGHTLRRRSKLADEGGAGDYRIDERLNLLVSGETKGIVSTSVYSVYGRKQDRVRAAYLSSEDLLADDWEIAPDTSLPKPSSPAPEARDDTRDGGVS